MYDLSVIMELATNWMVMVKAYEAAQLRDAPGLFADVLGLVFGLVIGQAWILPWIATVQVVRVGEMDYVSFLGSVEVPAASKWRDTDGNGRG